MDYRKIGDNYYIRMDRRDEIISNLLEICRKESISSAVYSGIGGCQSAELQVFIPETGSFETERLEGMLELRTTRSLHFVEALVSRSNTWKFRND